MTAKSILRHGTSDLGIARAAVEALTELVAADPDDRHLAHRLRQQEKVLALHDPKFAKKLATRPVVLLSLLPAVVKAVEKKPPIVEPVEANTAPVVKRTPASQRRRQQQRKANARSYRKRTAKRGPTAMQQLWRQQRATRRDHINAQARKRYKAEMDALSDAERKMLRLHWRVKKSMQ